MYKAPTKKELKEAKKPRPITQWMVFSNVCQEQFKENGATFASFADKMAEISRRWKEVPDEDKTVDPPGKWQRRADRRTAANLAEWEAKQGIEA